MVVSTDVVEAQLIELSENLYTNTLSALDRGIFVMKFREIHEEKFGKIDRTRNLKVATNPRRRTMPLRSLHRAERYPSVSRSVWESDPTPISGPCGSAPN